MSRLGGGRSITDRVIYRQDTAPVVTDSVVWIDTDGEQPQAKIYNPGADEWQSVGVVQYGNLVNRPTDTEEAGRLSGDPENKERVLEGIVEDGETETFTGTYTTAFEYGFTIFAFKPDISSTSLGDDSATLVLENNHGEVLSFDLGPEDDGEWISDEFTDASHTIDWEYTYTADSGNQRQPELDIRARPIRVPKHIHPIPDSGA